MVVFNDQQIAERAATCAKGSIIHGGKIVVRGPAEQRRRGYNGIYQGTVGYVPAIDKRPLTDCYHYATDVCHVGFSVSITIFCVH